MMANCGGDFIHRLLVDLMAQVIWILHDSYMSGTNRYLVQYQYQVVIIVAVCTTLL